MPREIASDTQITPHVTAGELEEKFQGETLERMLGEDRHFLCDCCSKGVPVSKEPRVAQYLADDVLNDNHPKSEYIHRHRPLTQLATYCTECSVELLFFPCKGFSEARLMFTLTDDWTMTDLNVADVSPADDGIAWNPKQVSEAISGVSFVENAMMAREDLWGPENMFTVYDSALETVDMGDLIQYDGSLNPKLLGRARKEYDDFRRKMSEEGYNRRRFSKHTRGKD